MPVSKKEFYEFFEQQKPFGRFWKVEEETVTCSDANNRFSCIIRKNPDGGENTDLFPDQVSFLKALFFDGCGLFAISKDSRLEAVLGLERAAAPYCVRLEDAVLLPYPERKGRGCVLWLRMERLSCLRGLMEEEEAASGALEGAPAPPLETLQEVCKVGLHICLGLLAARRQYPGRSSLAEPQRYPALCHNDIKPDNIFYDAKTQLYKLGDWGSATLGTESPEELQKKQGFGSERYMAPEVFFFCKQKENQLHLLKPEQSWCVSLSGKAMTAPDDLSEIYSIGMVLRVLCGGGEVPYAEEINRQFPDLFGSEKKQKALQRQMTSEDAPPLEDLEPEFEPLRPLILHAMEPDRLRRGTYFSSLEALGKALADLGGLSGFGAASASRPVLLFSKELDGRFAVRCLREGSRCTITVINRSDRPVRGRLYLHSGGQTGKLRSETLRHLVCGGTEDEFSIRLKWKEERYQYSWPVPSASLPSASPRGAICLCDAFGRFLCCSEFLYEQDGEQDAPEVFPLQ